MHISQFSTRMSLKFHLPESTNNWVGNARYNSMINWLELDVIYQVEVWGDNKIMYYHGSMEDFKVRYYQHKVSIKKGPSLHTTLSSYVWKLKDDNISYKIKWSIKARGHTFSSGGRECDLCLTKRLVILTANQNTILKRRDKLLETCRHRRKHMLVSKKNQLIDTGQ